MGLPPSELKRRTAQLKEQSKGVAAEEREGEEDGEVEDEDAGPPTLIERVRQAMMGQMDTVLDTFKRFDLDGSMTISAAEFAKAMATLGFGANDAASVWSR